MSSSSSSLSSSTSVQFQPVSPFSNKRKEKKVENSYGTMAGTLKKIRDNAAQNLNSASSSSIPTRSVSTQSLLKKKKKKSSSRPSSASVSSKESSLQEEEGKDFSEKNKSGSPRPDSPAPYHFSSFYEQASDSDIRKVVRSARNKGVQTVAPDTIKDDVELIQKNYEKISESRKSLPIRKPSPIKVGPDVSILLEHNGIVVQRNEKSRTFDVHRSTTPTGERRATLYPKTGHDFVPIPGKDLEKHITAFRSAPKSPVSFLRHVALSMETSDSPEEMVSGKFERRSASLGASSPDMEILERDRSISGSNSTKTLSRESSSASVDASSPGMQFLESNRPESNSSLPGTFINKISLDRGTDSSPFPGTVSPDPYLDEINRLAASSSAPETPSPENDSSSEAVSSTTQDEYAINYIV